MELIMFLGFGFFFVYSNPHHEHAYKPLFYLSDQSLP